MIRLQNLGLLRLGGDTGRIVPDLFSDYLIQNAFPSGQGDPLLNRLYQSDLFYHQNTSIFRNLALAQWHQQLEIKNAPSLVEPLWKKFQSQFEIENDSKREVMLKTWKRFGLYLPDESLTLCRKAIELKPNPPGRYSPKFGTLPRLQPSGGTRLAMDSGTGKRRVTETRR